MGPEARNHRFFAKAKVRLLGCALAGFATAALPSSLSAQAVETKSDPEAGDMVLLRDVPMRAGQKQGRGDALVANPAPQAAFDDAIASGVNPINDAEAEAITSSALSQLDNLQMVDDALGETTARIADVVRDSQSIPFADPNATGLTSFVNGSVGAALNSANSATRDALGSINSALGGLNPGGPGQ